MEKKRFDRPVPGAKIPGLEGLISTKPLDFLNVGLGDGIEPLELRIQVPFHTPKAERFSPCIAGLR
jgi:hypothetical protein